MKVATLLHLDSSEMIEAWNLYERTFTDLARDAVQEHLMDGVEFRSVMRDDRWSKYLCYDDDDQLIGLSTYTNDLHAVHLVSNAYFAHHYPVEYQAGRIWYVGFVAVPDHGMGVFGELLRVMYADSATENGVTVLDMCSQVELKRRMPGRVRMLLRRLSGKRVWITRLDAQSYWLYEFPAG